MDETIHFYALDEILDFIEERCPALSDSFGLRLIGLMAQFNADDPTARLAFMLTNDPALITQLKRPADYTEDAVCFGALKVDSEENAQGIVCHWIINLKEATITDTRLSDSTPPTLH